MDVLVTLEGVPHAGRSAVLKALEAARPDWTVVDPYDAPPPHQSCWAPDAASAEHAMFSSLLRKLQAVARQPAPGVTLLTCPWFDHLPRVPSAGAVWDEMARELARRLSCRVARHAMVQLCVPPDECFEQMVCGGNPHCAATTLADVRAAEAVVAARMRSEGHPFPSTAHSLDCPPFFDENEVVVRDIARRVVEAVEST